MIAEIGQTGGITMPLWFYLSYGLVLGLSAGISPGPLQLVVISQTLRYGPGEGFKVAVVPLITDPPIIGLVALLLLNLPHLDHALGLLAFAGAGFLLLLSVDCWRAKPVDYRESTTLPRSYLRGILVNALSPHPYIFWALIGVPTMLKAGQVSIAAAVFFVVSFYLCLVGAKMGLVYLLGRSRRLLSGPVYLWVLRLLGLCLVVFALLLLRDGLRYSGILPG